ncbi:MAG: hypothetical protein HY909_23465 [Deltaproteobacteria bacterium]|nr:hypothetical protein [Deltaproteobacteria bacterium]
MTPRAPLLALLLGVAPVQCPTRRGPELAREDTPGDALWGLAERFGQRGDEASRRATLEFLVERYPSSRFAPEARRLLGR